MAWCPRASPSVPHIKGKAVRSIAPDGFGPVFIPCDGSPMTVRGGGDPTESMANSAGRENGPAASELRTDAHHCIMVWVSGPPNTRMWHESSCTTRELPSDDVVIPPTNASVPSCSEPSRTSPNGCRYAPSLTAPARAGVSSEWVGAKKQLPRSNKETEGKKSG